MIKSKKQTGIEIDLTGPDGNAFVLIGKAGNLAKQLKLDSNAIQTEMMNGDYEHLVNTFDKHFGHLVTLYR
jgi:hypothetical protein